MTRRDLLLHLLERAGERGCTTAELLQGGVGSRYGARVKELRSQGYEITAQRVRDGSWRYILVSGSASTTPARLGQPISQVTPAGAEPDAKLFEAPAQSKTRSAITGERLDDAA